jgi:hypothetical protein
VHSLGAVLGVGAALREGYRQAVEGFAPANVAGPTAASSGRRDEQRSPSQQEGFSTGGFDVAVVMAGNNKDSPEEIPLLLEPIAVGVADFVQGSRYLKRNASFGEMPYYRRLATRVHPLLFSLAARRYVTESTNGFRAVHRRVLTDPRIDLSQPWLDEYELEPYLYLRAIQCGFRTVEVPVSKVYPPKALGQTKMQPITGWWSILRPLVLVGLGLRR